MERLLAHAVIWRGDEGWAARFNDVLNERLAAGNPEEIDPALLELAMADGSRDEVWGILRREVLSHHERIDKGRFESELVHALEAFYRDPDTKLGHFARVAYGVWEQLESSGLDSSSLNELAFADDFLQDGEGEITRAYYEDLFGRYR